MLTVKNNPKMINGVTNFISNSEFSEDIPVNVGQTDTCSCPEMGECVVKGNPVLGGVDFVQYFTSFQLSDGSYNESEIGEVGSSSYSTTYNGNTFYFISESNKALFDKSPSSYVPQFGGFCGWGIGGEYCPPYPWDRDCLGPSGNWGHWTIQNEKLYLFFFEEAKSKFMADTSTYISQGTARWNTWFPMPDSYFNTDCYVTSTASG